jgi:predicted alpha/beta hydrolase family esterase
MKQQILFIQGGGEGAYEIDGKLVAFLRGALGAEYEVRYPRMPSESDPDYERWKARIKEELAALQGEVVLVGHSLGGSFLLKYLVEARMENPIAGIFLIAVPYWGGDGWKYEGYQKVALPDNFASKLPSGTPIFLYHGRDDEVAPFAHLALYAGKLPHATIRALDGRGHQLDNDLSEVVADVKALKS